MSQFTKLHPGRVLDTSKSEAENEQKAQQAKTDLESPTKESEQAQDGHGDDGNEETDLKSPTTTESEHGQDGHDDDGNEETDLKSPTTESEHAQDGHDDDDGNPDGNEETDLKSPTTESEHGQDSDDDDDDDNDDDEDERERLPLLEKLAKKLNRTLWSPSFIIGYDTPSGSSSSSSSPGWSPTSSPTCLSPSTSANKIYSFCE